MDATRDRATSTRHDTTELLAAILDSYPGYVALLDATGDVFAANVPWITLHREHGGESIAAAAVGENYCAAIRQVAARGREHAATLMRGLDDLLGAKTPQERVEMTCAMPDGRQLAVVAHRLRRPAGGAAFTAVDVTPWSASVRALKEAQRDLLIAAQRAVAGELVGGITHDLRQPLTSLQINLDTVVYLLRQSPAGVDRALAVLQDAIADERSMRDSVQLLGDLVARREPRKETLDLDTVVSEVVRLLHAETQIRGVHLVVDSTVQLPPVYADRTMVREAVLALALDAVEHADVARDASVAIAVHPVGTSIEVTVSHARQRGHAVADGWVLSIARTVGEAHGATVRIEERTGGNLSITTVWPTRRESTGDRT